MKCENFCWLEHAHWPALLVDAGGIIRRVNRAGARLFGAISEGALLNFSAVWGGGNGRTFEQYLAETERDGGAVSPSMFRPREGAAVSYLTGVCSFAVEGQKYFVVQLFSEADSSTSAKNH